MLELPAYSKYVKKKVLQLKHEEKQLESKLTAAQGDEEKEQSQEGKEDEKTDQQEDAKEEDDNDEKEDTGKDGQMISKGENSTGLVASRVNFWRMSHNQQESVLVSSSIYIIGGVLAALLFKQVREKHFAIEPATRSNDRGSDFSFSIFGCLAEPKLCVLGFCCPCLAWADTSDQNKGKGLLPYWPAFLSFFGLLVLEAYTMGITSLFVVGLGVYYRQKLRQAKDLASFQSGKKQTLVLDIVFWVFCQPCAIIQEAREESVNQGKMLSAGP